MTLLRRLFGTALFAPLAFAALPAAGEVIDRILVHVNARIVTQSQLDERTETALREAPPGLELARREEVRKAALRELLNEALLEDRARELDIVATDAEVEEQIKRLKEQNKVASEEDFVIALKGSGLTPEKLRDQLKRSTTIQRVVGREVNSKVDLSDDALRLAYEREKESWAVPEKVRLAEVLINAGPGAEEKAKEASILAKGGAKFEDVVVRFSDGPTRSKGGDMGTVGKGELAAALDAVAFSLPTGAISDPIETRTGWHVLKIVEKLPATFKPYSEVKADILKKEQETQFQKKLAEYLEKLEREAVIKVSGEATAYYQPPVPAPPPPDSVAAEPDDIPVPSRGRMRSGGRFEITPTVGYRFGGTASTSYSTFIESVEISPDLSFGMTLEYALRPNVSLEFIWSHQDSELKLNYRQPPPAGYSERLTHLNVDTFQIGGLWQFGTYGDSFRPYLDFLLGLSILTPAPQFSTLTRFSGSVGGGAKYTLSDAMGFRLGIRFMPIYLNS
ncbi:MAG TPA: peptidylprolyl isomerase, partial [Thermoanaerobaculia bacterium]|nr:peptidylprolyl isomerase [Thermoanaerobaculia bacterium]